MAQEFVFKTREEKKNYVERMFGQIARRYDFFNHFLSLGFDYSWRKRAIQVLRERGQSSRIAPHILDIACGTGDLSFEALRQSPDARITGVDLAQPMLDLFRAKAEAKGVAAQIERGDVENLQFSVDSFDGVTIG